MPDINNALALSVKQPDIGETLLKAGQINYLRANTAKTQQDVDYNALLQSQGQNNMRPQEENTLADAHQKHTDLRGRAANEIYNDPSDTGVQMAFKHFEQSGVPLDDATKQKILAMPQAQRQQTALNLRNGAMPSSTNMEATGETMANQGRFTPQNIPPGQPIISRTAAATGGQPQGFVTNNPLARNPAALGGPPNAPKAPPVSGNGRAPVVQMTDRMVPNSDGSLPSVPKRPGPPVQPPGASFDNRFPSSGADMFTPSVVKGPDGSISSSVTPATTALQGQATARYAKAGENADNAQALTTSLDMMDHSADVLNSAGWSSTGAGANAKMGAAKSVNSMLQTLGLPPAVDPNKVSNWEDLNKETTRAGFKLASTLGSREAASIVQSSVGAVPSAENTPMGFKLVTSGIRQAIQREKDYYAFATDYAQSHRGNTFGADVEFNKQFPPELYAKTAIANSLPPEAIKLMKSDPKLAGPFDAKYGKGMSGFILHHDQAQQ